MTTCQKNHRYAKILEKLPYSQSNQDGRHLCAGRALEKGFSDGLNDTYQSIEDLELPESQAGTTRHKSAQAAYELGYNMAKKGQSLE